VKPSSRDLNLLSEHLCYEVEMTCSLAAWMLEPPTEDMLTRNAVLESWTIHVRQLIDFLWPQHRHGGENPDALAADLCADGEWDQLRPERPDVLSEAIRNKIGWGVAHLTYGRARSKPEDKQWDVIALTRALAPALIVFVDSVEPEKLDPEHVQRMKWCAEAWGGRGGRGIGAMQHLAAHT
jgi:hypothetical protein